MTSHAELSRDLALAIGYHPESVRVVTRWVSDKHDICEIYRTHRYAAPNGPDSWHPFDYRSPDVAVPLLVWLMVEHDPMILRNRAIPAFTIDLPNKTIHADTLEEAIARACIAVGRK